MSSPTAQKPSEEKYFVILRGWRVATVIANDGDDCRASPSERCGGCSECLLMQASHYGMTIRDLKGFWKLYEYCSFHAEQAWYWLKEEMGEDRCK